jgi:hypothetical protein
MQLQRRPWFYPVVAVAGVVAASFLSLRTVPPPAQQPAVVSVEQQLAEAQQIARIERLVRARLRDPESAVFRHIGRGCGYVNARNGYGGMAGDEPFIVGSNDQVAFHKTDPKAFAVVWQGYCLKPAT